MMQMSRRHHSKSRGGCKTCKSKKIKCNEAKPTCQYCALRSLDCEYPALEKRSVSQTGTVSPAPTVCSSYLSPSATSLAPSPGHAPSQAATTPLISLPSLPSLHTPLGSLQWSLLDLELLHFYTAQTSQTFSSSAVRNEVWRNYVPKIAFSNHFLLHGILALSAVHLSRLAPERKSSLSNAASQHNSQALPMFIETLDNIDDASFEACALFGMVVAVYEWAKRTDVIELFFHDEKFDNSQKEATSNWIHLLHGSGKIIARFFDEIDQTPLVNIISIDLAYEAAARENLLEQVRFEEIRALWKDSTTSSIQVTEEEFPVYDQVLERLQIFYTAMAVPEYGNNPSNMALAWLCTIDASFFTFLTQRRPIALVLLAHFTLLLNKVEDFWWLDGISRSLLREINKMLGHEGKIWLAWPMQDLMLHEFRKESASGAS